MKKSSKITAAMQVLSTEIPAHNVPVIADETKKLAERLYHLVDRKEPFAGKDATLAYLQARIDAYPDWPTPATKAVKAPAVDPNQTTLQMSTEGESAGEAPEQEPASEPEALAEEALEGEEEPFED